MKKLIMIFLLLAGIFCFTEGAEGKPKSNIRILDASKMSSEKIWNTIESCNGNLIIVETHGVIKDSKGNGKDELGYTKYHGVPKGARVTSYFVFNPSSNTWDDIILRCDYVRGELIYVR